MTRPCAFCEEPFVAGGSGNRKFCRDEDCARARQAERLRKFRGTEPGDCARCGSPLDIGGHGAGRVCAPCSEAVSRRIWRWLEDQPKPLEPGAVPELAAELGISVYAASKRISRIRRGARLGVS